MKRSHLFLAFACVLSSAQVSADQSYTLALSHVTPAAGEVYRAAVKALSDSSLMIRADSSSPSVFDAANLPDSFVPKVGSPSTFQNSTYASLPNDEIVDGVMTVSSSGCTGGQIQPLLDGAVPASDAGLAYECLDGSSGLVATYMSFSSVPGCVNPPNNNCYPSQTMGNTVAMRLAPLGGVLYYGR